ncbi:hypothetical protein As57867_004283, partial [Aphanomyces stellatus]
KLAAAYAAATILDHRVQAAAWSASGDRSGDISLARKPPPTPQCRAMKIIRAPNHQRGVAACPVDDPSRSRADLVDDSVIQVGKDQDTSIDRLAPHTHQAPQPARRLLLQSQTRQAILRRVATEVAISISCSQATTHPSMPSNEDHSRSQPNPKGLSSRLATNAGPVCAGRLVATHVAIPFTHIPLPHNAMQWSIFEKVLKTLLSSSSPIAVVSSPKT